MSKKNSVEDAEEFARNQYRDSLEAIRAGIEKKNVYKNLTRCLSEDQRNQKKSDLINQAKELSHIQQHDYDTDEQLSRELDKIKRDEIAEKRLRQHLRLNSHELQALETKLRAAYINKEILAQIAEKDAERVAKKNKISQQLKNRGLQKKSIPFNIVH